MHKAIYFLLVVSLMNSVPNPLEARGGRGEGFRGDDDQEKRPAQAQRVPSMSRSMPQPTPSSSSTKLQEHHSIPKPTSPDHPHPSQEHFIQSQNKPQEHPTSPKPTYTRAHFPQKTNLDQIKSRSIDHFHKRQSLGEEVRTNIYKHDHHPSHWFNQQFWHDHPNSRYRHPENTNWWKWATWPSLAGWFTWDSTAPIYYDYGENGNVYYNNNQVFIDGTQAYTANEYAEQADSLANSIPQVYADQTEWLPLGVFALTSNEKNSAMPNMYLQLAVNREGIISGNYINKTTQSVQPIEGRVDPISQIAVWRVKGSHPTPSMETGMFNLTQDETPLLIHFPDGTTQTWLMVRLQEPEEITIPSIDS